MSDAMSVIDVFHDSLMNDGGTYGLDFDGLFVKPEFTSGYMVSLYGMERQIWNEDYQPFDIQRFIENRLYEISTDDHYLGIWYDDKWFLDISVHFEDEEEAEAFAIANAQLAYWDCKAGVSISL